VGGGGKEIPPKKASPGHNLKRVRDVLVHLQKKKRDRAHK